MARSQAASDRRKTILANDDGAIEQRFWSVNATRSVTDKNGKLVISGLKPNHIYKVFDIVRPPHWLKEEESG